MLLVVKSHFSKTEIFWGFWGHFWHGQNRGISRISKLSPYFDSHSRTKKASTFVEVSIESSDFRAFDRALNEGASYFTSKVIPLSAPRKCYFLGPIISKMSKLAALWRPLLVKKMVCPPPHFSDSKILFLGAPEIPKTLSERNNDGPFGRTDLQFEITRLYP